MTLPEQIVQVDVDPFTVGRYYGPRTTSVLGDARQVLGQLAAATADLAGEAAAARKRRLAELATARADWLERTETSAEAQPSTVGPDAIMRVVRAAVPDETVAVFDAGNPGIWSYLWPIRAVDTYLKPVGFGNMGFAVPAAVGASIVAPETPIVAFVGDGSLGMSLGELETLAREQTNAVIVVMNDSGYGNIRQEQKVHYGESRTIGVDFGDVDYAAVARACGVDAVRVTDEAGLAEAVRSAISKPGPFVVDVVQDPEINAWTYPLFKTYELED